MTPRSPQPGECEQEVEVGSRQSRSGPSQEAQTFHPGASHILRKSSIALKSPVQWIKRQNQAELRQYFPPTSVEDEGPHRPDAQ
ncbi:hypothetical protein N7461_002359 [Penicillium sp. DV-2018c]|nr:hypothetical protein N7461_002359 [Penicillium sp. DV-2018c]